MEDLGKFVGIPHHFGESSWESCDCVGLARLFYREHGWQGITDGKPEDSEEYKRQPYRILRYFLRHFDRVELCDLVYGDIVVLKVMQELHIGVFTEYNRLLTMEVPVVYGITKSCLLRGSSWKHHAVTGFRRRSLHSEGGNNGNIPIAISV